MHRGMMTIQALARMAGAACLAVALSLLLPLPAASREVASLVADSVMLDRAGRLVASGSVEIWHGSARLTARQVVFDRRSGQLSITGPITLSDGPDRVVLADEAELSRDLREGIVRGARLVLDQQLQVAAASVERRDGRNTHMDAVIASTCRVCAENPTPLWEIRADRVTHDEERQLLHFRHAQFRLGGVPLLHVPRLRIPAPGNVRAAGVLAPRVDLSGEFGVSAAIPYFMPLGPDRDLTLTPIAGSRGMLGLGLRYRQAFASGGVALAGQFSRDRIEPGRLRGYAHAQAHFALAHDFRLDLDLLVPGDRTYLDSYDITGDSRLESHLTLERIRRDQAIRARILGFYSLPERFDNRTLPNLAMQVEWEERIGLQALPVGGELRLRFAGHAHRRQSSADGDDGRDLARLDSSARWHDQAVLPGGLVVSGGVQGRIDHVRINNDSRYPDPVTRYALQGMADLRFPMARVEAGGARQLLEPVAQLVLSHRNAAALPNDDHRMPELDGGNLFALSRYGGHDAPDDGTRLNAGLRWMRHAPGGWSVEALAGRIWRRGALDGFDPGHVQPLGETRSDWLIAGRIESARALAFDFRVLIDDDHRLTRGETNLTWERGGSRLRTGLLHMPASAAEARDADISEWSLDMGRSLGDRWFGRLGWEYDIAQQSASRVRSGLEFRNECLSVDVSLSRRFATSTNLSASTRFGISVELLGIGGRAGGGGAPGGCPG